MLTLSSVSRETSLAIYSRLSSLQDTIYPLDRYGETVWAVSSADLRQMWDGIYRELARFGFEKADRDILCAELAEYQDIEINRRKFIEPTEIEIGHFYRLKTCDVRLSRRIASLLVGFNLERLLKTWDMYDMACEVCDDLQDIVEDRDSFNANRFLISSALCSTGHARAEYLVFAGRLAAKLEEVFRTNCDPAISLICKWTQLELDKAISLLTRQSKVLVASEPRNGLSSRSRDSLPASRAILDA